MAVGAEAVHSEDRGPGPKRRLELDRLPPGDYELKGLEGRRALYRLEADAEARAGG